MTRATLALAPAFVSASLAAISLGFSDNGDALTLDAQIVEHRLVICQIDRRSNHDHASQPFPATREECAAEGGRVIE